MRSDLVLSMTTCRKNVLPVYNTSFPVLTMSFV